MYCWKCGKEISENSFYCKFCGNSVKGESMNINMDVIITFLKSRTKELFIFGMWFLFNSLLYLLIGNKRGDVFDYDYKYGFNIYQICTFIAPLFYWGFREVIKYLLDRNTLMSSRKVLLRIISFLIGSIPVFFILVPFTLIIGGFFRMHAEDMAILNLIFTIIAVEFFYRDLFKRKTHNGLS